MSGRKELHDTRLATTDETGKRVYIYPEDIKGYWSSKRHLVYWILMLLLMVIPWIHFNGRQMILLDIAKREFIFFGNIFYAHDTPMLFLILVFFILIIGLVTSIWGRLWCGWACPQTVFINSIFLKIEQLVEGPARTRRDLDRSPISFHKIKLKTIKWFLFTLVSLHITHSFLGWFVGSRELLHMSLQSPLENFDVFITMLSVTAIFLFDFGWFREQFCIIACPYGRIQSVMMDEHSLVVAYDNKRGEPRRNTAPKEDEGDCINCNQCVKACPTGIDIRRGTQLECIACTNCIDACDTIMNKVNRPHGLIRYTSEAELTGEKRQILRPRNFVYLALIIVAFITFIYVLVQKSGVNAHVLRAKTPFFQTKVNDEVIVVNQFKLFLEHHGDGIIVNGKILDTDLSKVEIIPVLSSIKVDGRSKDMALIFKFPKNVLSNGTRKLTLGFFTQDGKQITTTEVTLVGPLQ